MKNFLQEYKKAADRYISTIIDDENVEGIMHLGGIAREYADKYSDIDLAVFSSTPLTNIKLGEQLTPEKYDLEVFNVAMNDGFENWSSIQKEAYQEGYIYIDKHGKVKEFIDKALYMPEDLRIKKILEMIFDMAWHGWVYSPFKNKTEKGYYWCLPNDLWKQRGVIKNAYYVAQVSFEHFIELLFWINRRWLPDFKWRLIKSYKLKNLPTGYREKADYILFEKWDESTWPRKEKYFRQLIDETISAIIPELPDDWYEIIDK